MLVQAAVGAGILASLAGLLLSFGVLERRRRLHPEIARKGVHVGMGLISLSLPLLYDSPTPVWVLGSIAFAALIVIRRAEGLRRVAAAALDGVERAGHGELYFPVAVMAVFYLSDGDPVLYGIPILILTFADASAALAGQFLGRRAFTSPGGEKTIEGSAAFLATAFVAIAAMLASFTSLPIGAVVLIAVLLALLLTLFEAIAWAGMDNLLVPLGAYFLLDVYTTFSPARLAMHLSVVLLLLFGSLAWQRRGRLRAEGVLVAVPCGYLAWAFGGSAWLSLGLTMSALYALWAPAKDVTGVGRYEAR